MPLLIHRTTMFKVSWTESRKIFVNCDANVQKIQQQQLCLWPPPLMGSTEASQKTGRGAGCLIFHPVMANNFLPNNVGTDGFKDCHLSAQSDLK
ncbi:conserved hypothetical protein [Ricinus communis]|uniref:Uncharacterized protein n=1 Tax=Ricinus communis TaxID=3988 RepID=B9RW34_RICCO|nr:conserved hypothetical protein [Ricinus communis]